MLPLPERVMLVCVGFVDAVPVWIPRSLMMCRDENARFLWSRSGVPELGLRRGERGMHTVISVGLLGDDCWSADQALIILPHH